MIIGKWNKSVILTYLGVAFCVLGMFLCGLGEGFIKYSFICLMFVGVCDLFDGYVARKCKRTEEEKAFGRELDSLADVLGFVAFPIVLLFNIGLQTWYSVLIFILYAIGGIARLGYFMILTSNDDKPLKYYTGLPVTSVAIIYPFVYLLSLCLEASILNIVLNIVTLLTGLLFVLRIKIKKPRGLAYAFFAVLAIVMAIVYILFM